MARPRTLPASRSRKASSGRRQRVGLGVQRDVARLGQHHQLGEVVVRADEVADDVDLRGDDVDRRDADRAAVADHEVRPGAPQHPRTIDFGPLLGDEVDDDLGTEPARQVQRSRATWPPSATHRRRPHRAPWPAPTRPGCGRPRRCGSTTARPGIECRCGPARRRRRRRRSCPGRAAAAPCGRRGRR